MLVSISSFADVDALRELGLVFEIKGGAFPWLESVRGDVGEPVLNGPVAMLAENRVFQPLNDGAVVLRGNTLRLGPDKDKGDKHQGPRAFRRPDHFRQHLKVYHRLNKQSIDSICAAPRPF